MGELSSLFLLNFFLSNAACRLKFLLGTDIKTYCTNKGGAEPADLNLK